MTFIVSFTTWFNWLQQQINNEKRTHRRDILNTHFRAFLQREFEHFFYFNNVRIQHDVEHETRDQIEILEELRRLVIDRTRENQWIFDLKIYRFIEKNKISKQIWAHWIWLEHLIKR